MISRSSIIIGPIIGDILGSIYEWKNNKTIHFDLFNSMCDFTDDSVLTIAIADCILNNNSFDYGLWKYGRKYGGRGYGAKFMNWLDDDNREPYNSFGNGSAMRVSPIGYAFNDLNTVLDQAAKSAIVTHNHPEGIKGAQCVASSIYLSKNGKTKDEIKDFICSKFEYDLNFKIDDIRPSYKFDATCQGSVPHAIVCFLESNDFENAIRLAISLGGDSDTIACITASIASSFYKNIPDKFIKFAESRLPIEFINIINEFDMRYN
jgi:ADP-ribosylglycohydrolase